MEKPVVGVIAEYNPFHNGHAHHITRIRQELPGAAVLCAMSGHVVQRGEVSICRKQARTLMALRGGVDLLLELPAKNACASAEGFARAGVALLAATGLVSHISFGSESGRLDKLEQAARLTEEPAFLGAQSIALERGVSYASARSGVLADMYPPGETLLLGPNDMLGVEYLRAMRFLGCRMQPLVVLREGAAHDMPRATGTVASASLVRTRWLDGRSADAYVPRDTMDIWREERSAGRAPVSLRDCEAAVLSVLRKADAAVFCALHDVSEGLEFRLASAARRAVSLEEFYAMVKTRRYTHARIRRIVLRAYMGLDGAPGLPPYLRVLGANGLGLSLLHKMKKTASLPILTKPASVRGLGVLAAECFDKEARVTDLYALCYPDRSQRVGGQEWRMGPVIVDR